jgi:DNA mismatch repair ATPase MutS
MARMEDRWGELPARETRVDASASLFARDLDLFGRGGLFDLLCTARTSTGEDALAMWLLEPATLAEARARQEAVGDLRQRLNLAEELASCEGPEVAALDAKALAAWGTGKDDAVPAWLRWVAPVLVALTLAAAVDWALRGSPVLLVLAIMVDASLTYSVQKRMEALFLAAERAARSLHLTAALIARLQSEPLEAPLLQALQSVFVGGEMSAAKALARLATLAELIDNRRNLIIRALDAPLLYSVQLAGAVQTWRRVHGTSIGQWLTALGELEALVSLATYSYEHSDDPFPELVEGAPCFEAQELGHPLIAAANCVRNDVALAGETRLLLVSGSNMSGKSTLMRAVGINAVLAMAGTPVRATRMRMTPMHVGASIQVNDSLQEGRSRFYAEILRLRAICALAEEQPPVLFLLDELLGGTNSSDRLTGAEGIARALMASGAVGLISTHDLALTSIGGLNDGSLRNVHFEDHIENGQMHFDFKLREGAVTTKNGIALMRMIGLKA